MLLYDLPAGMNTRRVRIFLAEKGVTVPTKTVDAAKGENSLPEFIAKNPMGKLPMLELDDGSYLSESLAICRYIEHLHPEPPLMGKDGLDQARVEMWTRRMEFELARPIMDVFFHTSEFYRSRITQIPAYGEQARAKVVQTLEWLDAELAARAHIAGEAYTIADIVAQCALVLGKAVGIRPPAELANLGRWFASVTARPSARA